MLRQQWLMLRALALTLVSLNAINSWAGVGKVTEQTGPTEIVRSKKSLPSTVNTPVEMNDTIITAKAKAKLTFEDNTTVNITEQSKLVIDDFVYDPKKGTGKVAMKVVLGTARYASGQIAKTNPQAVDVKTPTATVAVRGTDFSMTVDELGRSLIMLLPSCDNRGCVTGAIMVSNDAGSVFLDTAYQATVVPSLSTPPTQPIIVSIDQSNINNLLIVSPPVKFQDEELQSEKKTALDFNFLDQDFLKRNDLDEDELKRFRELDLNYLDGDLLANLLDLSTASLAASQESMLSQNTMLPGYNAGSGLTYAIDAEDDSKLVLRKGNTHVAQVTVNREASAILNITQDGSLLTQQINRGGSTVITIIQK